MSAEKITYEKQIQTVLATPVTSEMSEVKFSGRVDINHLRARARKEKEKENRINLVCCESNFWTCFNCWNSLIFLITYFHI